MKLVPVDSLSDEKQLTYGDLKPDTWFSEQHQHCPLFYKTKVGYIHTDCGKHVVIKDSIIFTSSTPVRVYKVELRYERVE